MCYFIFLFYILLLSTTFSIFPNVFQLSDACVFHPPAVCLVSFILCSLYLPFSYYSVFCLRFSIDREVYTSGHITDMHFTDSFAHCFPFHSLYYLPWPSTSSSYHSFDKEYSPVFLFIIFTFPAKSSPLLTFPLE